MNYEYKVIRAVAFVTEKELNELGKEGWRLVQILLIENLFSFYFMRAIE